MHGLSRFLYKTSTNELIVGLENDKESTFFTRRANRRFKESHRIEALPRSKSHAPLEVNVGLISHNLLLDYLNPDDTLLLLSFLQRPVRATSP